MQIIKLLDVDGNLIANPEPCEGSVSWNIKDAVAEAWDQSGADKIAEMNNARIRLINSTGMWLEGMEPISEMQDCFRAMEWFVRFEKGLRFAKLLDATGKKFPGR